MTAEPSHGGGRVLRLTRTAASGTVPLFLGEAAVTALRTSLVASGTLLGFLPSVGADAPIRAALLLPGT
jgi:hypothetical protein